MKLKHYLLGLFLALGLIWAAIFQFPDNRLHLVFCDVGQGDTVLVTHRQAQVLIDGGPNNKVLDCLSRNMPFWDRNIEMVVLTHPETDHFTGLIDVIERYNISQFVINGLVKDSAGFWKFQEAVLAEGKPVFSPQEGDRLKIGPMEFLVLWPQIKLGSELVWQSAGPIDKQEILGVATYSGNINDTSIVLKLSFGDFDALFTGDISEKVENQLGEESYLSADGRIEVLKVAHHGSKYSTSDEFLEKVRPALAVISVGKNPYGHPAKEVLERLSSLDIKILRTDEEGEIRITSDGKKWRMN